MYSNPDARRRGNLMKPIMISFIIMCLMPSQLLAADLPTVPSLQDRLAAEVQKMIDAGHLAPGICYCEQHYVAHTGTGAHWAWDEYWHNPAEFVYALSIAIPHLPTAMQSSALTYLEAEFDANPPYTYVHIGTSGAHRSFNGVPAEYAPNWGNLYGVQNSRSTTVPSGQGFSFYPFNIYACWKFAQLFPARVNEILAACQGKVQQMPDNIPLHEANPHIVNMYIAGYYGYQGLRELAGLAPDATVQAWLDNTLAVRVQILDYSPATLEGFEAGGFCWLVPELGAYLRANALPRVKEILAYEDWARSYWYVARAQECTRYYSQRIYMEGYHAPVYDYFSLFAARAHILQLNQNDLIRYLDAPAVYRGDLYYIQDLVHTMEASTSSNLTPTVEAGNNQVITLPDNDISLDATVTDDGLPNPPAAMTRTWTKQVGPGTVTFANANAVDTSATFSTEGVYILRLTASDGDLTAYDTVTITVYAAAPQNDAPLVDAGPDRTLTLPDNDVTLDATVTDDGLPNPPAALTQTWTKQSGPGTIIFANPNAVDTAATFSDAGIYVLHLTASDFEKSSYDEVIVTVNPAGSTTTIDVNNYSFELPGVTNPATGEDRYKNEWDSIPGWTGDNTIDSGVSATTVQQGGYDPTDGLWSAFTGGSDAFYQFLSQTMAEGETYILTFDTLNVSMWQGPANAVARFIYDNGGTHEVIAEVTVTMAEEDVWHNDQALEFTIPPAHPSIGLPLGLEFANTAIDNDPCDGSIQTWNRIDNIRLTRTVPVAHNPPTAADFNNDGAIDPLDLAVLAAQWLQTAPPGLLQADICTDGTVNLLDAAIIANSWLE
jgi:hypothetical protein